jgi:hypothetical protein
MTNIMKNLFTEDSLDEVISIDYHPGMTHYRLEKSGTKWNYFEDRCGKNQSSPDRVSTEIVVQYLNRLIGLVTNPDDLTIYCTEDYKFNMVTKKCDLDIDHACETAFNALFGEFGILFGKEG